MLHIDGTTGEGGGQILRTALALSAITGTAFEIDRIRGKRAKPGLRRQHLTCVRAAAQLCGAHVTGDEIGSTRLRFAPGSVKHGDHRFAIGTAGSTSLVLQTVLPALLRVEGRSRLVITGGTHNPLAPSFEFLAHAYLPRLHAMGVGISAQLVRHGFYPAGGGEVRFEVAGTATLQPQAWLERGPVQRVLLRAVLAELPEHIGVREVSTLHDHLRDCDVSTEVEVVASDGPGNVLSATVRSRAGDEVFTGLGEVGVRAETVAQRLSVPIRRYLAADVPIGEHLADQLLIPMALAGEGTMRTLTPSLHTTTNAEVIRMFLPVRFAFHDEGHGHTRIDVTRA